MSSPKRVTELQVLIGWNGVAADSHPIIEALVVSADNLSRDRWFLSALEGRLVDSYVPLDGS
ncbi:MAG TPA: hypothetical protein VGD59_11555 [Acidisarcina sp.]